VLAPSARATTGSDYDNPIVVPVPVEPIQTRYALPPPPPVHPVHHPVPLSVPVPVRSPDVLVVPSNPSYSYTYSYSGPDGKHPHRDNTAFVDVRVNS